MLTPKPNKFLRVPDADEPKQFLKLARAAWRRAHPESKKKLGRPLQEGIDLLAIKAIATSNAGVSRGEFKLWSQGEWISAIGDYKEELLPGKATLKKNLKKAIKNGHFLFPLQQIPASIVQEKSVTEQLDHWYSIAFLVVLTTAGDANSSQTFISYNALNYAHRSLCSKHMLKRDRPTEKKRQQWCLDRFKRLQHVPIQSRKPSLPAK